jgi:hypothetical protein
MAKFLNEAARGCEPTHLMLSPNVSGDAMNEPIKIKY